MGTRAKGGCEDLPDPIDSEGQLDEILSRPSDAVVAFMAELEGDILVLGAGGKIGPTLVRMARRACDEAGVRKRIVGIGRRAMPEFDGLDVETVICDLLDPVAVATLPRVRNVFFLAGRKFGSTGSEHLTWMMNVVIPYHVALTFTDSRVVVFSTGCVYPLMHEDSGGADESVAPAPVGEYAMSCLGRERVFDYYARSTGEDVLLMRLNYAVELRYGVLFDVAWQVWNGIPVDVTTGRVNVIWEGDACAQAIRCLGQTACPAAVLNVTGPETISIPRTAETFGKLFGKKVLFRGKDTGMGYLSDALRANTLFGVPSVPAEQVIRWVAHWVQLGGGKLGKPTHFETQTGKF